MKNIKKLLLLQFMLFFWVNVNAQNAKIESKNQLVKDIIKFLLRQGRTPAYKDSLDMYSFNLKILLKRTGNFVKVSDIVFSDSIGHTVIPGYQNLRKFKYEPLMVGKVKATILIPILVLIDPKHGNNPKLKTINISSDTYGASINSLLYPSKVQEDIILFPLISIVNLDIKCPK
ncbi:hypothetical protein [Pedobacter sp. MW01-1-1]|uniref:hypothetical protein n=1 Tax=Pedobacter sp. MW01-1-1 TaxID=3383027 RepID=UPI003FEFF3CA